MSSPITARYAELGGSSGPLGASTTPVVCGLRSGGCYQGFAGGTIYWSPGTRARFVSAAPAAWTAKGVQSGTMGYPVTDTVCGLADSGCFQRFRVGSVHSSAAGGVHVVWGSILQRWAGQGWETGPAGYPTGGESCHAGGCRQQFRGAVIRWSPSAGTSITAR